MSEINERPFVTEDFNIVTKDEIDNLGEKSGWRILVDYGDAKYAFYLGTSTWPNSDSYRCSNLDIDGKTANEYRQ